MASALVFKAGVLLRALRAVGVNQHGQILRTSPMCAPWHISPFFASHITGGVTVEWRKSPWKNRRGSVTAMVRPP